MTAPDWTALRPALHGIPTLAAPLLAQAHDLSARLDQAGAHYRAQLAELGADLDDPTVAHAVLATVEVFCRQLDAARALGVICPVSWLSISASQYSLIAALRDHIPGEGTP